MYIISLLKVIFSINFKLIIIKNNKTTINKNLQLDDNNNNKNIMLLLHVLFVLKSQHDSRCWLFSFKSYCHFAIKKKLL